MTILVLGSTGLAGSAICRNLELNNRKYIAATRNDVNLLDAKAVDKFFSKIKPRIVIGAAALVGGMAANIKYPVEFLINNINIQNNTMLSAFNHSVDKYIFLGSSCMYPSKTESPIFEHQLLTGSLEKTNEAYAIAKISGLKLIQSFRDEYSKNWISVMPTNLYGPGDNFDIHNSHVLAALVRKFYEAVLEDKKEIITRYIKDFPTLAQNGITLDHLAEIFYTKNQRTFIEDMEEHFDFKINYAYVAKYDWADIDGDICPSVIVKDLLIFLDRYHKYCIPFKVFDFNNDTYITLYISRANSVIIERNDADDNYLIFAR
jgi:hypothetical protein